MNIKHSIGLNLSADAIPGRLHMVQGDANSRTIVATLWDGAQLYSIPAGAVIMVRFRKPDGTGGLYDATESGSEVSYAGSIVTAPVATQMLVVAGDVFAEIDIFGSSSGAAAERLATFRFVVEVAPCVLPDAEIISSDYYNILAADIADAKAAADLAKDYAASAKQSADSAAASVEGAVKYNAPQTLTDAQKQQARDNIGASAPYTAGENISITGTTIDTKAFPCNPKILDNWYFGNPVNQRNGKIAPAGITLYADSALTQERGPNGGTEAIDPIYTSPTSVGWVSKIDGLTYYAAASDAVPGYKGFGYGIDRWKMWQAGGTVTVENGGIVIRKSSGEYVQWGEVLEADVWGALVGRQVTMSALTVNGQLATTTQTFTEDGIVSAVAFDGLAFHSVGNIHLIDFVLTGAESPAILAVGLELGSQQTLAHQENGVWVLNEIPDYGEQLRRCQRYARSGVCYTVVGQLTYAGTNYIIPLSIPQNMRATPAITLNEISAFGWGNVPIAGATVEWNSKYGGFISITDLSNMSNYIGKACSVDYFASADL